MHAFSPKPIAPTPAEIEAAALASRRLDSVAQAGKPLRLIPQVTNGHPAAHTADPIELPPAAVALLQRILSEMVAGHPVTIIPIHAELTTQEAADLLGVSRPYIIKLIDSGELPHRMVGTHRRVVYGDLIEYDRAKREARDRALTELVAESQRLGLYDQ